MQLFLIEIVGSLLQADMQATPTQYNSLAHFLNYICDLSLLSKQRCLFSIGFAVWKKCLTDNEALAESRAREQVSGLIQRLREPDFRSTRMFEMTRNPLLMTAICLVHRDRGRLPHRRVELYEECVKVLLERWRESKKLEITVDAKSARRILQPIAYWLHEQRGRTRATAEEMNSIVQTAIGRIGDKTSPEKFLTAIRDESGLLTGWSDQSYGFMHLAFQEYLAAREVRSQFFNDTKALEALAGNFGESWWRWNGLRETTHLSGGV